MKNPWIRKNPWLSLWLSGANTVMNRARAQSPKGAVAKQVSAFWTAALTPPSAPKAAKRRRRSR